MLRGTVQEFSNHHAVKILTSEMGELGLGVSYMSVKEVGLGPALADSIF